MAGNKKPRKRYVPRLIRRDTIGYVTESVTSLRSAQADYVIKNQIVTHAALADLVAGTAGREPACVLIATHYICHIFTHKLRVGSEHKDIITRSADALRAICLRGSATGDHRPTEEELSALNDLSLLHDALLQEATISEMEAARTKAIRQLELRESQKRLLI